MPKALVAESLDVPVALVSLVDVDRQWFKSRVGLEQTQTPRDISFCGHTILQDGVFEIPDAAITIANAPFTEKKWAATAGVDVHHPHPELRGRAHRAGDRVGDVVELEIEEDRQAEMRDFVHPVRAVRAEEFEAELQSADMALHLLGKGECSIEAGEIEGEVDRVAHGVVPV